MIIQIMLNDIYATQKRLDEEAHHNLKEYVENAHRYVQEMAETQGFTLRYGTRIGGYESVSSLAQKAGTKDVLIEA